MCRFLSAPVDGGVSYFTDNLMKHTGFPFNECIFFTLESSQICVHLINERVFSCDTKYTRSHTEAEQAIPIRQAPPSGKCESFQCGDVEKVAKEFSMEKFWRSCSGVRGTPLRNQPQYLPVQVCTSLHTRVTHTHTLAVVVPAAIGYISLISPSDFSFRS